MLHNYKLLPLFSSYQLKYHFFMEAFSQPVSLGKGPSVIFTHNIVSFFRVLSYFLITNLLVIVIY